MDYFKDELLQRIRELEAENATLKLRLSDSPIREKLTNEKYAEIKRLKPEERTSDFLYGR
jgi:hypothetical protein